MACRSVHVSASTRFIHRVLPVRPHGGVRAGPCQRCSTVVDAEPPAKDASPDQPLYLSDMMRFESDIIAEDDDDDVEGGSGDGAQLIDRATKVLGSARELLLEFESDQEVIEPEMPEAIEEPPQEASPPRAAAPPQEASPPRAAAPPQEAAPPRAAAPPQEAAPPREAPPPRRNIRKSKFEAPSPPPPIKFSLPSNDSTLSPGSPPAFDSDDSSKTREVLTAALDSISMDSLDEVPLIESEEKPWESSTWEPSPWEGPSGDPFGGTPGELPGLQLQQQEQPSMASVLPFAEMDEPATLTMQSQSAADAVAAKSKTLPPFQRVVELTSAAMPPVRGAPAASTTMGASQPTAARDMEDGSGVLGDGTEWERTSGEEKGENGFWKRWTTLKGVTAAGQVEWEETWWEVSDWFGLKEFGALKTGSTGKGGAWRETWTEKISTDAADNAQVIERSANKWARQSNGNEWEENWGENYRSGGQVNKSADKWAREGSKVWHEKWGEWYDGSGGCVKYTDKWAEALTEGGKVEWGDKWEEKFADGKGSKEGETWNIDAGGYRHQKWWGENHFGDGYVQKYGNSSSGESWDVTEKMDTYYNPIPHFGFSHALGHSPTLLEIPVLPKDDVDGGLGPGMGAL